MCREVSKDTMASVKLEAHDPLESTEIFTEPPTADNRTDEQRRRNCCKNTSNNSNNCLTTRSYPNYALTLV